jgi:hypothetical protein
MRHPANKRWIRAIGGSLIVLSGTASADAGYQDTTQITGGALVQMFRSIPFMPKSTKQLLDPMVTQVELRGNQLARVSTNSTEIIDLDQETVTRINNDKKTYTVTSFEEMRQAFRDASKKVAEAKKEPDEPAGDAAQPQPKYKVTFDVSVKDTGASKSINGVTAKEQVMTMKAHVTPVDPAADPTQAATFSMITDLWSAPKPDEMRAIDDFYLRYGKKLMQGVDTSAILKSTQPPINQAAMSSLFASQPGMAGAMPEMMKKLAVETQKIKGEAILSITRIGGEAMVAPSADAVGTTAAGGSGSDTSSAGSLAAKQVADDTTSAAVRDQFGKLGSVGYAFGNSVVGAFHRTSTPSPSATPPAGGTGAQADPSTAVLFETTMQKSAFTSAPVSAAAFQIPAGYTKIELASRTP